MSFKRFKGKKNDENFPSMVKFFNNIVNITQGKTWKIKSENSPLKMDFDIFYICMLIGIKYNLRENDENYQSDVFLNEDSFPNQYRNVDNHIIPILLKKIADNENYNLDDKDSTRQLINDFVEPSRISQKIISIMNQHSLGGYIKLLEVFDNKPPQDVGNFFIKINKLITI